MMPSDESVSAIMLMLVAVPLFGMAVVRLFQAVAVIR